MMRFVRYGERGREKTGLYRKDGRICDLSEHLGPLQGQTLSPVRLAAVADLDHDALPVAPEGVRLCKPVQRIGKIVGVGPNYEDSANLAGFKLNPEPTLFLKAATASSGPNDPIEIPRMAIRVDWGVELAVVVGRVAKYVSVESAMDHVAGFTLANDVTERSFQLQRSGQWSKGKSHDSFAPLGPWLVTPDELTQYDGLDIWLDVNGVRQQQANTSAMVFKIPYLISYISRFMRLEPGDVILTGSPAGVGLSYDPPRFLKVGDRVTVGGTGLGVQDMVCVGV